jgi:hypothetical protein
MDRVWDCTGLRQNAVAVFCEQDDERLGFITTGSFLRAGQISAVEEAPVVLTLHRIFRE